MNRRRLVRDLDAALRRSPVTALLGPRQCGKTTLARSLLLSTRRARGAVTTFDLEDPDALLALEAPKATLGALEGLVILDGIQRRPDLFPVLRVLADRQPRPARFLLLGSASPDLLRQSSESLAGRLAFVEMAGFDLWEVGVERQAKLWSRGGFPRSFLARSDRASFDWREDFCRTFLERDIPQLGFSIPALTLRRFWTMVAHYHGQTWNSSEVAASLGINDVTARRYLDLLAGAYVVRVLPPWFENLGKRQRKAPKVYLRDTGLLHSLLRIPDLAALLAHPKCGASWEGFVIEQILRLLPTRDAYSWAVHDGSELDLLVFHQGRRIGFEIKRTDTPALTRSMTIARDDLRLDALWVVYPGTASVALGPRIRTLPLARMRQALA